MPDSAVSYLHVVMVIPLDYAAFLITFSSLNWFRLLYLLTLLSDNDFCDTASITPKIQQAPWAVP